jgi:hypothetical protein
VDVQWGGWENFLSVERKFSLSHFAFLIGVLGGCTMGLLGELPLGREEVFPLPFCFSLWCEGELDTSNMERLGELPLGREEVFPLPCGFLIGLVATEKGCQSVQYGQ